MRYGEIVRRAWKDMWSGGLWGFLGTVYLIYVAIGVVLAVAFIAVVGIEGIAQLESAAETIPGVPWAPLGRLLSIFAALLLVSFVLILPVAILANGGIVFLSNERAAGRRPSVSEGWGAGLRLWPRVFTVDIVIWLINLVVMSVFVALIFGALVSAAFSADPGAANPFEAINPGTVVALCGCGGIAYLVMLFFMLILQAWEALSVRHVVIDGLSGGQSISSGWSALARNFKRVFLLGLLVFGISFLVSMATSIPSQALEQIAIDNPALESATSIIGLGVSLVSTILGAGIWLFTVCAWTEFYRDMRGMAYQPAAPGYYYPQPPSPTWPTAGYAPPPSYGPSPYYPPSPAPPATPVTPSAPPATPPAPPATPPAPPATPPASPQAPADERPIVDVEPPAPSDG